MKGRKILISILNLKGLSGAVNYVKKTSLILKEKYGLDIDIITSKKDENDTNLKIHTIPLINNFHGYFKRKMFAWYFNLISGNYDIVNGHGELISQDVLTLHNLVHLTYEKLSKPQDGLWLFHEKMLSSGKFKKIIANSELMKKDLISRFNISEEKIKVIYPSFNPSIISQMPEKGVAKKDLGLSPSSFCFLLPASGDFTKRGVNKFINIFAQIYAKRNDCQAIITGKDASISSYQVQIKKLGLENKIKIIPPLKEVKKLYACADCVIYPAVLEEFGIALNESMACSIPVLCSKDIGVLEIMSPEARNFSICLKEEDFISKALALMSGKIPLSIFQNNADKIRSNTWEKTSEAIYSVYSDIQ